MVSSPWHLAVLTAFTSSLDGFISLGIWLYLLLQMIQPDFCLYSFPGWYPLLGLWLYLLLKLIPWIVSSPWPLGCIICFYSFPGWFHLLGIWLYLLLQTIQLYFCLYSFPGWFLSLTSWLYLLLILLPWVFSSPWLLDVSSA